MRCMIPGWLIALGLAIGACGTSTTGAKPSTSISRTKSSFTSAPAQCPATAHQHHVSPNGWARAHQTLAPAGVLEIRLCRYSGLNGHVPPGKLVRSRLITNRVLVEKLVIEFDALKPFPSGAFNCPSDDGSLILALLAYPRRHSVVIEVDQTGCQGVTNGDVVRIANGLGSMVGPKLERQLAGLTQ